MLRTNKMTDLTEQWKKGELEEGFYYVKCPWSDEIEVRYVHNGTDEYECIVAPVPSYEEFDNIIKCYLCAHEKANRFEKENQKLKENIHSMLFTDDVVQDRYDKAIQENKQLKELLKLARSSVDYHCALCREYTDGKILIAKIDEVLND
jgi:hypothetical protein